MNKYLWLIIVGIVIIGGGIAYTAFIRSEESAPVTTGNVREITITARKLHWTFDPEEITVERGDKIILTVVNEDDFDHGFSIDAFGISQRVPANQTIKAEFVATQVGDFPYYCSVPCGDSSILPGGVVEGGAYAGEKRGHFDQIGKMHVRSIISETQ
ncbi:MAG: cupredoxin domain-containing protein [Candidatus Liptonbacteria bacterium]|nr:cupredoxin domain-containing protein [Candidatus Liptonbacteria bacterium]